MYKPFVCLLAAAAAASAVFHHADNLVTEGVPDPSLSLVEELDRYTNARSAVLDDWHPSQRKMLINTRFADTSQVHEVDFPGGARQQLTFFRDSAHGASFQSTTGKYLVYDKDSGGDEFYQKYRYDPDDHQSTLLTDGKSRNTGGVWSNHGEWLAYGSTRRNGRDVDIYAINPAKPNSDHPVAQLEGGGWEVADWSPDDSQLLLMQEISVNETYLWLVDTKGGGKKLLTPKPDNAQVAYGQALFSRDGQGIYLTTDRDNEFKRLAYLDLASGEYQYLTSDTPWDVEDIALSWDGKQLAYIVNEDGFTKLHLMDTASRHEKQLPELPHGQISGLTFQRNNGELGFNVTSAKSPGDVYSLDTESQKIERWTYSETGAVESSDFPEPKLVHWQTMDGKQLSAFLYQPNAGQFKGKRPVIVDIHGGPEAQWRPHFLGRYNYLVTKLGIALLYPNVRGSTGYGKTFTTLDNGFKREDSYRDIGTLLEWIGSQPDLDKERIMITGGSYGGNMTLACAQRYSDKIRCALDIVGPSNLATFLKNTSGYRRDLRRVEYGDEREPRMMAYLEGIAPANHAQEIKKPLFVVQGMNDPRVPASESEQMVKAVRSTGVPVWYLLAKDEGHGFSKKANSDFLFYASVEFVKQFLLQ